MIARPATSPACMPICIRGQVIGIVQMVNKENGYFTKVGHFNSRLKLNLQDAFFLSQEDEEAFEMFSIYCGLSLHHAKLYDKIRRSEQKYKVALEVLSYHNSSAMDDVEEIISQPVPKEDPAVSK